MLKISMELLMPLLVFGLILMNFWQGYREEILASFTLVVDFVRDSQWFLFIQKHALVITLVVAGAMCICLILSTIMKRRRIRRAAQALRDSAVIVKDHSYEGELLRDEGGYYATATIGLKQIKIYIDMDDILAAFVRRLVPTSGTPSPESSTPTRTREMAVAGSVAHPTEEPASCFILHNAPAGSASLKGYVYAIGSRTTVLGHSVIATAAHVIGGFKKSPSQVFLRKDGNDYPVDKDWIVVGVSPVNDLDVIFIKVPPSLWSVMKVKALKIQPKAKLNTPYTVWSVDANCCWTSAVAFLQKATGPYRVSHSGTTNFGSSGSPMISGGAMSLIHTNRIPDKGLNEATALQFLAPKRSRESSHDADNLFEEAEWDPRANDEDIREKYQARYYSKGEFREFRSEGKAVAALARPESNGMSKDHPHYYMLYGQEDRSWGSLTNDMTDEDYARNPFEYGGKARKPKGARKGLKTKVTPVSRTRESTATDDVEVEEKTSTLENLPDFRTGGSTRAPCTDVSAGTHGARTTQSPNAEATSTTSGSPNSSSPAARPKKKRRARSRRNN